MNQRLRSGLRSRLVTTSGVLASLTVLLSVESAHARTITANLLTERVSGTSGCTLREAVQAVNTNSSVAGCGAPDGGAETIKLVAGTYNVRLNAAADTLTIDRTVTIVGTGYAVTTISPASAMSTSVSLFHPHSGNLTLQALRVDNIWGEAVLVDAGRVASLRFVQVTGSGSNTSQGCVGNYGTLYFYQTELDHCKGWTAGGVANGGIFLMDQSAILRTTVTGRAGAINNSGSSAEAYITNSTLARNHSNNWGTALSNNSGAYAQVDSATIAFNDGNGTTGWALYNDSSSTLYIKNTLITDNIGPSGSPNCSTNLTSLGYNYLGRQNPCVPSSPNGSDVSGGNPLLDKVPGTGATPADERNMPLSRGGLPRVYVPLDPTDSSSNPLRYGVDASECQHNDQRGLKRRNGGTCEIGAADRGFAILVVGNYASPSSADINLKNMLATNGIDANFYDDDMPPPLGYGGMDEVIISDTVVDSTIATKYKDASVGVLVNKASVYDNMAMVATNAFSTITGDHVITLQVGAGTEIERAIGNAAASHICTNGGSYATPAGVSMKTALYNNGSPPMFSFSSGATVAGGYVINNRRSGFPGVANFFTGSATSDGNKLFMESVFWTSAGP